MSTERKNRDVPGMILAAGFILLGLWVLWQSAELSPLGSVFPRTIAAALIVFSLILIAMNLRRPRGPRPREGAEQESSARRVGFVAVMAAWVFLLPVVGFFVSCVLGFFGLLAVAEYERWTLRRAVAYGLTGVVLVAAFYFLLRDVLYVPVPRGILF